MPDEPTAVVTDASDPRAVPANASDPRAARTLLFAVIDALPNPAVVFDGTRCVLANAAYAAMVGRPVRTLVGMDICEIFRDAEIAARSAAENEAVLRTGVPFVDVERSFMRPDGVRGWFRLRKLRVELPGGRLGVLSVGEDMTTSHDAQEARARSDARFRRLVEHAPDAIVVHRAGLFVYANPATAKLLGRDPESLPGRPVTDIIHPAELEVIAARTRRMLASGESEPTAVLRFIHGDGHVVLAETVPLPMDWDGTPAVLVFARDVTRRVQVEQRVRQAERLASVGTLAAGVAHEVNNPLMAVTGNLSLATELLPEALREITSRGDPRDVVVLAALGAVAEALAEASAGAARVREVVAALRAVSHADDASVAPLDVCAALESAIALTATTIGRRARLVRVFEGDGPWVAGRAADLGQVFVNLLMNAAQAIPEGAAAQNEVRVSVRRSGAHVVIEVADTGAGIAPELLGRIFDPFFTTRDVGAGAGLGLAVSRGIVTAMGGEIAVESTKGAGAVFRVTLPAAPSARPVPPAASAASAASAVQPRCRRVLVVDDEPAIGRAIGRMIAREHHEFVVAGGAREALRLLAAGERFDLVLCDLMMPGMTGIELFEQVTARDPAIAARFVFVTGGAFTAHAQDFLKRVPNARLDKPLGMAEIRTVLARA